MVEQTGSNNASRVVLLFMTPSRASAAQSLVASCLQILPMALATIRRRWPSVKNR
jgi:hypothetical protein